MPIVLLLFFVASFTFTGSKAAAVGVAATSGVLLAVRTAMIYQDWREKEAVTFAMQEDLARIKPGALMLITDSKPQGRQSYLAQAPPWQWHIPLLQLFRKPILAPTFFASPEGQPMLIRGKYAELKPFPTPLDVRTVDHELDRYFEGNPLARSFSQIAVVVNHYHDPVQVATMQGETINRRDYSLVLLAGGRGR